MEQQAIFPRESFTEMDLPESNICQDQTKSLNAKYHQDASIRNNSRASADSDLDITCDPKRQVSLEPGLNKAYELRKLLDLDLNMRQPEAVLHRRAVYRNLQLISDNTDSRSDDGNQFQCYFSNVHCAIQRLRHALQLPPSLNSTAQRTKSPGDGMYIFSAYNLSSPKYS